MAVGLRFGHGHSSVVVLVVDVVVMAVVVAVAAAAVHARPSLPTMRWRRRVSRHRFRRVATGRNAHVALGHRPARDGAAGQGNVLEKGEERGVAPWGNAVNWR